MLSILNAGQNYRVRGGSDRYMIELGRLLAADDHRVIPFAARHPENIPTPWEAYFPRGVDFERPGLRGVARFIYSADAARCIERLATVERIDIAHLHIYYGQLTASILGPLCRREIPIVQTLHEYKVVCPVYTLISRGEHCERCAQGRLWNTIVHRCNRGSLARSLLSTIESGISLWLGSIERIDRFIAVSEFQREVLVRMGLPVEKVRVIHNFVNPEAYPSARRRSQDYVLYFGRVERVKGIFTLLDAMARLPDIPLKVVGGGGALEDARQYARDRGLGNVELVGFKEGQALTDLIGGALCAVLPSQWHETFGLTSLESYVYSKPVVASRMGGIPEVVVHGDTGLLVPPGDPAALARAIRFLADDPDQAEAMGMAGNLLLRKRFSPEAHRDAVLGVYRELLSNDV
jgi:glycosyltransferase involved in cell wall biosynthesis